jgi:hypothetical protein
MKTAGVVYVTFFSLCYIDAFFIVFARLLESSGILHAHGGAPSGVLFSFKIQAYG